MKNAFKYIYIILFFFMSILPMGLFVADFYTDNHQVENIEKGNVKEFPILYSEAGINNSFDDECEAWLNQNIPYRAELLTNINGVLSDYFKMPTSNVVTGQDGWIFSTETIDNYMDINALSETGIKNIGITLSLIQERIESKGSKFLFVPVPNKNSIYPEYMPKRYTKAPINNLDRLYGELDVLSVNHINLKKELLNAKAVDESRRLYYKKDTHWTDDGALIGYKFIMEGLGITSHFDNVTSQNGIYRGDLDKLLYPAIDKKSDEQFVDSQIDYDSFEFTYPSGVTDTKAQLENFMSDKEDHDNNFSTKKAQSLDKSSIYMIRDSFGRALLPFMIDSFDEATFVRTTVPSVENACSSTNVVYEICERNLKNLISSAPYMLAPQRQVEDLVYEIFDSEYNRCICVDEGYAYRIFGTVDNRMLGTNGRIFVKLANSEEDVMCFEAFPIYEKEMLQKIALEGGIADFCADETRVGGYSMYIAKNRLEELDYSISLVSGNYESNSLGNTADAIASGDNSQEIKTADYINPYQSENAKHQILYRGATIGIGDNIYALKRSLGDQAAPSEKIVSCLSGADAYMYYYPNITLETDVDGEIYYISLMDNSYDDGLKAAVTEAGIAIGSDKKNIWDKLGKPAVENDKNCTYKTEHMQVTYSYKSGKVTSVILENAKYINEDNAIDEGNTEITGMEYENGNAYLYDETHAAVTGWQLIDGKYYFFDRLSGERVLDQVVDGITIDADGNVNPSEYEKNKIETMMKAHEIMLQNTNPSDTMEEKRRKVFDWVLSFPYHRYRDIGEVYTEEGIEIVEANDIFEEGSGDCVSESAALAFLFHEIGYNNVYWVHDTGHSWVRSDNRLFDPLFAEARDFDANYDAEFTDYRDTMTHSMKIY